MLLGIQAGEISQTIGLAMADGNTEGDVRDALPVHPIYQGILPTEQHPTSTKKARKTNHAARFNDTLRQPVSRLVQAALSVSKKRANPMGAMQYCMDNYNR